MKINNKKQVLERFAQNVLSFWENNLRDEDFLYIADDLFSNHDNSQLLSQLHQASTRTAL